MHRDLHKKEMKKMKGVFIPMGLIYHFNKESYTYRELAKEKGFLGLVNCVEVNTWGKLMEDKGNCSKRYLCGPNSVLTFCLQ